MFIAILIVVDDVPVLFCFVFLVKQNISAEGDRILHLKASTLFLLVMDTFVT